MSKHDIDKLFKDSFQDHQEKTGLSEWNSFVEFKDQEEKKRRKPVIYFKVLGGVLVLALSILLVSDYIFVKRDVKDLKEKQEEFVKEESLKGIALQNTPDPSLVTKRKSSKNQSDQAASSKKITKENKLSAKDAVDLNETIPQKINPNPESQIIPNELTKKAYTEIANTQVKKAEQKTLIIEPDIKQSKPASQQNTRAIKSESQTDLEPITSDISSLQNLKMEFLKPNETFCQDMPELNPDLNSKISVLPSNKNIWKIAFSSEIYPYQENDQANFLSFSLGMSYEKPLSKSLGLTAGLNYTFRNGSYNYSEQENYTSYTYAKNQNNYALIPESLSLVGLSIGAYKKIKKTKLLVGVNADYLFLVLGRLYFDENVDGLQSTDVFQNSGAISSIGIIDKTGFNDFQWSVFAGLGYEITDKWSLDFKFNYLFQTIAQENNSMEDILMENKKLLSELSLNYKF